MDGMTQLLAELSAKYGEEFPWFPVVDTSANRLLDELKRELGAKFASLGEVRVVAESGAADDVLFALKRSGSTTIYRIYHLTYSSGTPHFEEFLTQEAVSHRIEQDFVEEYL